jgi:phenylacetate-CoA ligase
LKNLLLHAAANVPYYQRVLREASVVNDQEVTLSNFARIPPLNKEIIRREKQNLFSRVMDQDGWVKNTSGGSTGEPVELIQDKTYCDMDSANKLYWRKMLGKKHGDREVMLWGSERDILGLKESWRVRARNFLINLVVLNAFMMSQGTMERYVEKINELKPVIIYSYLDSAYELAKHIKRNNLKIFSPKSIIVTAGRAHPVIKEFIGNIFRCPVYNQYGSREAGDMAVECPERKGLHVFEYLYFFEILDEGLSPVKPGEVGEVYVTVLMNYAMPLIRYKIGDTASWIGRECTCGRHTRLIQDVHGRIIDHFRRKDGTIIFGDYFTHLFYFRPWVRRFQVVQRDYDLVECNVALEHEADPADLKDITYKIKKVMGDQCQVSFKFVTEVLPSRSGKYLYTICELANESIRRNEDLTGPINP